MDFIRNKNNIAGKITQNPKLHKRIVDEYEQLAIEHKLIIVPNSANLEQSIYKIEEFILFKFILNHAHIITLSGVDGSGKTSVANNLKDIANILNIDCVIFNIFYQNMFYKIMKNFGIFNRKVLQQQTTTHKKYSFYRALATYLDSYIQYFFIRIIHSKDLIVFDRFFYDYLVSFEYLGVGNLKLFETVMPQIKSSFILISNPENARNRKPEGDNDYHKRLGELYSKIAKDYNIKVIKVDDKGISQVTRELIKTI